MEASVDIQDGALIPEAQRFRSFGCPHTKTTLPAVIMDAVAHRNSKERGWMETRCSDFINCAMCATDLRIKIMSETTEQVGIKVEAWQCFGGRHIEQKDAMEQATLGLTNPMPDLSTPPTRKLECLYNHGQELEGSSQRTWLQLWLWRFSEAYLEYKVPSPEGNRMVEGEARIPAVTRNRSKHTKGIGIRLNHR
ncbi:hypothetical protein DV735_g2251, partial [Chaetothyriales sp. CBS 134920]